MKPIRKLALIVNVSKSGARELAASLKDIAEDAGTAVKVTEAHPVPQAFLRGQDACCVIGGDGTLLGSAPDAVREQVPVIGVNRGTLGFLTTYSADEARAQFASILSGGYQIAGRSMLECSTGSGTHELALNEVVIKNANSRLVHLEVFADGELVTDYTCDGLIFSTPTGSTAYNLSAGGPIIHPGAEVVSMTPICPHTLSNRAIIFRHDVRLQVFSRGQSAGLLVTMDGQRNLAFRDGQPVAISIHPGRLQLVQRPGYSHFSIVRTKLKWSGGVGAGTGD